MQTQSIARQGVAAIQTKTKSQATGGRKNRKVRAMVMFVTSSE
jgi:hypothetical protein